MLSRPKLVIAIVLPMFLIFASLGLFIFAQNNKLTSTASSKVLGSPSVQRTEEKETINQTQASCPESCRLQIEKTVSDAIATITAQLNLGQEKEATPKAKVKATATSTPIPQNVYLPLGGGGSTSLTDWTVVGGSEFSFDLKNYPANAKVTWEASLKAEEGGSHCYVRLYDKNHYRAVDQSHYSTGETTYKYFASSPLSIWQGKNYYQIELKSENGVTCSLASPRLIISY